LLSGCADGGGDGTVWAVASPNVRSADSRAPANIRRSWANDVLRGGAPPAAHHRFLACPRLIPPPQVDKCRLRPDLDPGLTPTMEPALLSTFSALAGSAIGALTSAFGSWLNQRAQVRLGLRAHDMQRREDLYRDFIAAASKAYGGAILSNEPQLQDLVALHAMIATMRTLSAPETIACAERIMEVTLATYRAPNRDVFELQDLIRNGLTIDPLKEFSEAARTELRSLARA
jgi:hypothetical protein